MKLEEIERPFAAEERILDRGSRDRTLYVVRAGELVAESALGQRLLRQGDFFGELGALLGLPAAEQVIGTSDGALLVLDPGLLGRLCAGGGEFPVRLVRELAVKLDQTRAALLAGGSLEYAQDLAQVARVLLERRTSSEAPSAVDGRLAEIAKASGQPIRRVYTLVHDLLDRRIVRLVDDQLTLVEPEALESLAK